LFVTRSQAQGVDEYSRMLSAAASCADKARKAAFKIERERAEQQEQRHGHRQVPGVGGGEPTGIQAKALLLLDSTATIASPPPEPAPSLASSMTTQSCADRRALLLGESRGVVGGGGGMRLRAGGGGRKLRGGAAGERDVLMEERKVQERLEAELTGMTRALKGNVQAMHSTLVADNARLEQIDDDIAKGQQRLSKVNVRVDEQRMSNRCAFEPPDRLGSKSIFGIISLHYLSLSAPSFTIRSSPPPSSS
jgi:hypothetical protein